MYSQDIKELEKYGEDLREHYEKAKVMHRKTEQELQELRAAQAAVLNDNDELQKQCSLLKNRCHQLESERLPLIAQLEFADRNLRQVKKQQQQQQQSAMSTSTTVHHQPPLQSIENNNKSISRLIRSPSLDMRVMRRTSKSTLSLQFVSSLFSSSDEKMMTMDDTRSLDHDDLALLAHRNQSFNHNFVSYVDDEGHHSSSIDLFSVFSHGRSTDHLTKYSQSTFAEGMPLSSLVRLDIENEDEPIHLDLGPVDYTRRLTELQRRNLSQPKHLRTAYALETMDQDPDDFSASFIRKGAADENSAAGLAARQRMANENQKGSEVTY